MHENLKKMESFAYFLIFGVICVSFSDPWGPCSQLKNSMNSSQLPTGNYILSLLTLFIVPIYKVRQKLGKNCKKTFEKWKVWGFCRFLVSSWAFLGKKFQWNFRKLLLENQFFRVDPLKHYNPRRLSKSWQKMRIYFENRKNLGFLSFSVSIWDFFSFRKQQLSLRKSLLDNKLVPCWAFSTF